MAAADGKREPPVGSGGGESAGEDLAPGIRLPSSALSLRFDRGGGPGGQAVNKQATKATLTIDGEALMGTLPFHARARLVRLAGQRWARDPDRLVLSASEERTQAANRKAVFQRLRELLVDALKRPTPRRATRPTRGAVRRRLDAKSRRGDLKSQRGRKPQRDDD